jgi:redox-sensing transcriptional repressor
VVAAFDCDVSKLADYGGTVTRFHVDQLEEVIVRDGIRLAMLAVPAEAAQPVTDRLVKAGVQGILNFAPVTISVPAGVSQVAVDLAIELEQLCFAVVTR